MRWILVCDEMKILISEENLKSTFCSKVFSYSKAMVA